AGVEICHLVSPSSAKPRSLILSATMIFMSWSLTAVSRGVNCGGARRAEKVPGANRETCFVLRLETRCAFVFIELVHFLNSDVLRLAFCSPRSFVPVSSQNSKR